MDFEKTQIYWPVGISREMPGRTSQSGLIESEVAQYLAKLTAPGTQVKLGWMEKTTGLLSSTYLGMMNDVQLVADILRAQSEGYDAAVIGPHWDPGLYAAREAASIPVVGPLEAAIMVAQTLGRRFAVLTVGDGYVPMIERSLRVYGCESRALAVRPVRRFGMSYENLVAALNKTSDEFVREFNSVALECIKEGADVIIAGGQLFGPIFQKYGYTSVPDTGVPVVEVSACALKMAESLVTLRRVVGLHKSEHASAPFRTPPESSVEQAFRTFGFSGGKPPPLTK